MLDIEVYPDSKVHVTNTGPTGVLSAPGGPHAGFMNIAIRVWCGWLSLNTAACRFMIMDLYLLFQIRLTSEASFTNRD